MIRRPAVLAVVLALAWAPMAVAAPSGATAPARNPTAVEAYEEGLRLVAKHEYDEAISKLDFAAELEPHWSAPVQAKVELFAKLAKKYKPSSTFTAAQADELERLVVIEPGVDTARRKHEIAELRRRSEDAKEKEARRRKLVAPAAVFITLSVGFLVGGAMLLGMKPTRGPLIAAAYRQERRDDAAIAMLAIGGILAPPAIALGVLGFSQSKRDGVVRDYEAVTGRGRVQIAVTPQWIRGGGGMGMVMRF